MFIPAIIREQLSVLFEILKRDKENEIHVWYYFIQRNEVPFLDSHELDIWMTNNKVESAIAFKMILCLSRDIIRLYEDIYFDRDNNMRKPDDEVIRVYNLREKKPMVLVCDSRTEMHDRGMKDIVFNGKFYTFYAMRIIATKICQNIQSVVISHMPNLAYLIQLDFEDYDFKIPSPKNEEINYIYNGKKIPAKYYALYHWILIALGQEIPFVPNENDQYRRSEIEDIAKTKYSGIGSQSFYRSFIELDITRENEIAINFGKDYKKIISHISNNNAKVIQKLKKLPN
ncbi:hypothetical protein GCM10011344_32780 [Dokdonia pacifica]|uniref:Uncharacterized protein n=1 Tax=Dokdonia pacifica TaxID=1627892 RepID=A0A239BHJ5_9FLAO|nr:hypothetical protein [Dokdonia pacifica]GGG29360.1 hypothetical protein GCM10011344_32780 [Dokdonia pacifica]SNS07430.1 hypothetical protein SAMN06265376_106185 [Dokdonia pacifica]